jgi:hypothetical protein
VGEAKQKLSFLGGPVPSRSMYANNVSNLDQILSSLQCYPVRGHSPNTPPEVATLTRVLARALQQSSRVRGDVYNLLGQIPSLQPNCGTFGAS